ncbi:4'-phosphopantetheinyl transferase family protein [Aurantibacillus circumpalustris]|uniref:4'-phosphopantetheinyl transferase family protein n=1 Tax=Aurantibacillus circumpalustris TaxID=3036359 RepID=UPI00295AFB2B|nr:4'-phosphopantetheinyl transferase superfamily protein [Aurantibacillus circumpalustris]
MTIKEGDLHLWRYTLDEAEYYKEKSQPLLSKDEQQRCSRFVNEAEKIRYTCNHRFVRQVLAKYINQPASEINFNLSDKGKPFLENSDILFNYSYRTTFGLLGISKRREIGIDIEKMKLLHDLKTFADFSFSEKEKEIIFKSSDETFQDTLFTFWTFKEAMIKAIGVGLNADLTKIDLSDYYNTEVNKLGFNNTVYTMKQINAGPGYKAAFALKGTMNSYSEFKLD